MPPVRHTRRRVNFKGIRRHDMQDRPRRTPQRIGHRDEIPLAGSRRQGPSSFAPSLRLVGADAPRHDRGNRHPAVAGLRNPPRHLKRRDPRETSSRLDPTRVNRPARPMRQVDGRKQRRNATPRLRRYTARAATSALGGRGQFNHAPEAKFTARTKTRPPQTFPPRPKGKRTRAAVEGCEAPPRRKAPEPASEASGRRGEGAKRRKRSEGNSP